jgi:hypothetical protein
MDCCLVREPEVEVEVEVEFAIGFVVVDPSPLLVSVIAPPPLEAADNVNDVSGLVL